MTLQLGTLVRVHAKLIRVWATPRQIGVESRYIDDFKAKRWKRVGFDGIIPADSLPAGIIVGQRTLSDGTLNWVGYEEGAWDYRPKRHFNAYLIATSLRSKHFYALPEDVEAFKP